MPQSHLKFHSASGKRRVLVVEDEMINREILIMLIGDVYEVLAAETGSDALSIIDSQHDTLSLVLLDLNLPDMKGQDILRHMREDRKTALLPVIVMTADSDAEVECLNLGAIDFIPKPYPKQEVILARMLRTIELFEDRDIISSTERDPLTKLYNRDYFYRYAAQFDAYHPDDATDAVLVDINHFHILNERYGRAHCDGILVRIASVLLSLMGGDSGIVCRREADIFLIYCQHRESYEDLLEAVASELGEDNQVRIRVGVYPVTDKTIEIEHRFDRAKQASDTVRNSFSAPIGIYDDSLHEKELFAEQLMEDFSTAIREKQFCVHYQPKFDVRGEVPLLSSAEALVRWVHPTFGMISPGVFIPLFEENGLIRELDCFVWRETARQISIWKDTLGISIPVSVNVSRIDMYDPMLRQTLEGIAAEYGLSKGEMLLEITESAYTEDSEQIISMVNSLRESGFSIEMDDFGTGYSSLNMISDLPIDVLKLDMQFIRSAFRGKKDTRLLEVIIGLAKAMDLPVIAEGVETAEQMYTLKAMGCELIQGYYFSKPLPVDEFTSYAASLGDRVSTSPVTSAGSKGEISSDSYVYDALHDPETGLYNQSAFEILYRDSDPDHIAVLLARVEGYADILKNRGASCTRSLSERIASVLKSSFRSVDAVCRIRDDEYAIIMSRISGEMEELVTSKAEGIIGELAKGEGDVPGVSLTVGAALPGRKDPCGDIYTDARSVLETMKKNNKSGWAVY